MKKTFTLHFTMDIVSQVCYEEKPELLKIYFNPGKFMRFLWILTICHRKSAPAAVAGQTSRIVSRMRIRSSNVSGFFRGSRSSAAGW